MNFSRSKKFQRGFTLIELLIVIAILAILATVVFVGIDPLARFQDTRNSKRSADVSNILGALKLKQVDQKGLLLEALADKPAGASYMIGTYANDCTTPCTSPVLTTSSNCVDLSGLVTLDENGKGGYLPSVPVDPSATAPLGTAQQTGYYVTINTNSTLTVGVCHAEQGTNTDIPDLSVTR